MATRGDRIVNRRTFLGTLTAGLLATPLATQAQQAKKTPRVAFVFGSIPEAELTSPNPTSRYARAFLEGMRQLGWIDGQNVTIEWRTALGQPDRYVTLAQELVKLPVDVVVSSGTRAAAAARQASARVAIVVAGGDIVGDGLALSSAHPGGMVTGLTAFVGPEIAGKRVQFLKEAFPQVSRVAALFSPPSSNRPDTQEAAARALNVTLVPVEVATPDGFDTAFAAIRQAQVGGIVLGGSPFFWGNRQRIIEFAAKENLPAIYWDRIFAESGGLMSYGPDFADIDRRAAIYVDKILKGAAPGSLPIEQPTKFELVINEKTAKALGSAIPPAVLQRADEVIK